MSFLDMDVERIVEQYPDAVGKTLMTKQHTRTVLFYLNESGEVVTIFETHNQSLALEMRSRLNSPRQSGKTIKMNEIIQQIKQDNPLIEGHYLHLMVKDEYYSLRIGNVCIYTTKMKELALELQTSLNSEPKVFNNLLASLPTGLRLIVKPAPFGGEGWLVQDWDNRTQLTLDTKEIAEKLVSTHNQKQSPEAQPDAVIKLLSTAKNGYVQTIDRLEKELLELRLLEKQNKRDCCAVIFLLAGYNVAYFVVRDLKFTQFHGVYTNWHEESARSSDIKILEQKHAFLLENIYNKEDGFLIATCDIREFQDAIRQGARIVQSGHIED